MLQVYRLKHGPRLLPAKGVRVGLLVWQLRSDALMIAQAVRTVERVELEAVVESCFPQLLVREWQLQCGPCGARPLRLWSPRVDLASHKRNWGYAREEQKN